MNNMHRIFIFQTFIADFRKLNELSMPDPCPLVVSVLSFCFSFCFCFWHKISSFLVAAYLGDYFVFIYLYIIVAM